MVIDASVDRGEAVRGRPMSPLLVGPLLSCAALLLVAVPAPGAAEASRTTLSLQAGWWSVEMDVATKPGVYAAVGVPWMGAVLDGTTGGMRWRGAFETGVGYQRRIGESWWARAGVRLAASFAYGDPCGGCDYRTETHSFGFLELGIRYEHRAGFVAGLILPLWVIGDLLDGRLEHFPTGISLAFTQGYAGYAWRF
jgi:hypothetical protein